MTLVHDAKCESAFLVVSLRLRPEQQVELHGWCCPPSIEQCAAAFQTSVTQASANSARRQEETVLLQAFRADFF